MKRGVIVRADGGVSLFPWLSDEDAATTFEKWQESARSEWLPGLLRATEQNITVTEFGFHGSRTTDGARGQFADNALEWDGTKIVVNMPKAREVHAGRIAVAQVAKIARLKVKERRGHLQGNTAQADSHAATVTVLEALDLNALATRIANAPNPTALLAIWPTDVPRSL